MTEPVWARILQAYYETDMSGETFDKYGYQKMSRMKHLSEEINSTPSDTMKSMRKLVELNLMNDLQSGQEKQGYSLTKEGFQVAHDRNVNQAQNNVNRILGYLTVGLLFTSALSAMATATVNVGNTRDFILGYDVWPLVVGWVAIAIAVALSVLVYRSGILSVIDS